MTMIDEETTEALRKVGDAQVQRLAGELCRTRDRYAASTSTGVAPFLALLFAEGAALVAAERDRRVREWSALSSAACPVQVVGVELPGRAL